MFPAYSSSRDESVQNCCDPKEAPKTSDWLSNPSYVDQKIPPPISVSPTNIDEVPTTSAIEEPISERKRHRKKEKKSKHKRQRHHEEEPIQFTGNEEYYVDKKAERGYMTVSTLHRPACPKYRTYLKPLIRGSLSFGRGKPAKRYYVKNKKDKIQCAGEWDDGVKQLSEVEFSAQNQSFNRRLGENPGNVLLWLDFVKHQDFTHLKSSKTQIVERKMDILDKALRENPSNDALYKLYVDIINEVYPSFDVSKILDRLLAKDSTNYILWHAQILASQGSMARCIVPDVLKLYEICMKNMYNKSGYDEIMLKLFTNCCLFLRQSGLYEQFFALIKLSLELNISDNKFTRIQPRETDQHTLIEYEEVCLKSGLPMNEIWLRIEKLRQNFNFLPCPENLTCNDPQRIIFNEDVVHFVYPLANKDYAFNLVTIILKLLKVPLPHHSLKSYFCTQQDSAAEFDAVEELLSVFLAKSFHNVDRFDAILLDFIKEYSIGPSYIQTNIGYEVYLQVINEFLLICSECFDATSSKRIIFILIWLRFERILLILENQLNKTDSLKQKQIRTKIKNLLKREDNRNVLSFYTEYAMVEYELHNFDAMEKIFMTVLCETKSTDDDFARSQYYGTYIAYVEILIKELMIDKATRVLLCLAMDQSIQDDKDVMTDVKKLLALKKISDRLKDLIFIERNVSIMTLEQCFMPDYLINLIKSKIYLILLIRSKNEAIEQIEVLLRTFPELNHRHSFVCENLYEMYVNIIQFPMKPLCTLSSDNIIQSNMIIFNVIKRGLEEFPNNLILLRVCATLEGQSWYKIRAILTKSSSAIPIVFLVAAAKYRYGRIAENSVVPNEFNYFSSNVDVSDMTYKLRICNLLKSITNQKSILRKNSLIWRIYLHCLLDINKKFDQSRNALFIALDECPWNKALYLDGTVYLPQELPHIQDLIIEKQLRIYALPQELEILRSDENI